MEIEKANKQRDMLLVSILLSLCFSFNLFIFAPFESYLSNASELWFGPVAFMPVMAALFIISALICFALCYLLPGKAKRIAMMIITGLTLGFYVQGNYLAAGYPSLDGEEIPWNDMIGKGIVSTLIWVILLAIPILIFIFKRNFLIKFIYGVSGLILGIQIITLSFLMISNGIPSGKNCYLSNKDEFTLSKNQNIVVFVADTFEANHMERALDEFPELSERLKDFTFYRNTTGISTYTYLSMPTFFTNGIFPLGEGYTGGFEKCFSETDFYEKMNAAGYDVNYYTDGGFMDIKYADKINNLVTTEGTTSTQVTEDVSAQLFKFAMFRYFPHFLKPQFTIDTGEFNATEGKMSYPVYVTENKRFYEDLMDKGISAKKERNQYILYHIDGLHAPIKFNRNIDEVEYNDDIPYNDRRYEQALGIIKIFENYVNELKKAGVYDNTTIVFTTDHGNVNRYNNVFMVKPAGEDSDFRVSDAPVSLLEDYVPFILEVAEGKGKEAKLYSIPEDADRVRYVYNYYSNGGYGGNNDARSKIEVKGPSWDINSYSILYDEYYKTDKQNKKYKLGQILKFSHKEKKANVYGMREEGWAYSKTGSMEIAFSETINTDLNCNIKIKSVINDNQRMIIKSGDKVLFNETVPKDQESVKFTIPEECVNNGVLILDFEFPDTIRTSTDIAGLDWLFYESFQFVNMIIT